MKKRNLRSRLLLLLVRLLCVCVCLCVFLFLFHSFEFSPRYHVFAYHRHYTYMRTLPRHVWMRCMTKSAKKKHFKKNYRSTITTASMWKNHTHTHTTPATYKTKWKKATTTAMLKEKNKTTTAHHAFTYNRMWASNRISYYYWRRFPNDTTPWLWSYSD